MQNSGSEKKQSCEFKPPIRENTGKQFPDITIDESGLNYAEYSPKNQSIIYYVRNGQRIAHPKWGLINQTKDSD